MPLLKQSPDKRSVTAHVSIEKPEQWIKKQTVLRQMSHFPSNEKREKNISIHQSYRVSILIKVPQMTYLKSKYFLHLNLLKSALCFRLKLPLRQREFALQVRYNKLNTHFKKNVYKREWEEGALVPDETAQKQFVGLMTCSVNCCRIQVMWQL